MSASGWIGVDLDGTLAKYGVNGSADIGEPVGPMMDRVKGWLKEGREVRIVTARAVDSSLVPAVHEWLERHGLPCLQVTAVKDFGMQELWDDRARQVLFNKGITLYEALVEGVEMEPEFPGEYPAAMIDPLIAKYGVAFVLRRTVRITKEEILKRFVQIKAAFDKA